MKFSFAAFWTIVVGVLISGAGAFMEGTFTSKRVTMGFLNHGGMWGDLIIMSVFTGCVFPYIPKGRGYPFLILFISIVLALIAHAQWAKGMQVEGVTGHMFPTHKTGIWYRDLSVAGWLHVIVMAALLAVTLLFFISVLPAKSVLILSLLLTVHVLLGALQPGWYCHGKLWTWSSFAPPVFLAVIIWLVALIKIRFQ